MSVKEIKVNRNPSSLEDFLRKEELRKLDFKERNVNPALTQVYRGKDGRDYPSYEDMIVANWLFLQQQYPTTFKKLRVR